MRRPRESEKFSIRDLSLYFDTVAKDRLDAGTTSQRNAELLDLRDQLMRVSDQEFSTLMKTFRAAVKETAGVRADQDPDKKPDNVAQSLYTDYQASEGAHGSQATPKVSAVS